MKTNPASRNEGSNTPIERTVAYGMYRTSRLIRHLHYLTFQHNGIDLTPEQWFILNKLSARSPQSQTELGESIIDDRPNMTRLLTALESKNLISRQTAPLDRRRIEVSLTQEGRDTLSQGMPLALVVRDQLRESISLQELELFWQVLDKLDANIETIIKRLTPGPSGE